MSRSDVLWCLINLKRPYAVAAYGIFKLIQPYHFKSLRRALGKGKKRLQAVPLFCELRCEGKIKRGESMFFITPYQKNIGP